MRFFFNVIEKLAIKTGIPIGGVWLLILILGAGIFLMTEYPFYTQTELIIGFVMWAIAYGALWLGYRSEFWMDTTLLDVIRKHERGENTEDDETE